MQVQENNRSSIAAFIKSVEASNAPAATDPAKNAARTLSVEHVRNKVVAPVTTTVPIPAESTKIDAASAAKTVTAFRAAAAAVTTSNATVAAERAIAQSALDHPDTASVKATKGAAQAAAERAAQAARGAQAIVREVQDLKGGGLFRKSEVKKFTKELAAGLGISQKEAEVLVHAMREGGNAGTLVATGIIQAKQMQGAEKAAFLQKLVAEGNGAGAAQHNMNNNEFNKLFGADDNQAKEIGELAQLIADNTKALQLSAAATALDTEPETTTQSYLQFAAKKRA